MATYTLPSFEEPFYRYGTVLDGVSYVLEFRYNQREDLWYLSISLPDGTPLATGRKIVCDVNLAAGADLRLPKGMLAAVTEGNNPDPPGLLELGKGKRVYLVYVTADEVQ